MDSKTSGEDKFILKAARVSHYNSFKAESFKILK